jgi:hypothetical protein
MVGRDFSFSRSASPGPLRTAADLRGQSALLPTPLVASVLPLSSANACGFAMHEHERRCGRGLPPHCQAAGIVEDDVAHADPGHTTEDMPQWCRVRAERVEDAVAPSPTLAVESIHPNLARRRAVYSVERDTLWEVGNRQCPDGDAAHPTERRARTELGDRPVRCCPSGRQQRREYLVTYASPLLSMGVNADTTAAQFSLLLLSQWKERRCP